MSKKGLETVFVLSALIIPGQATDLNNSDLETINKIVEQVNDGMVVDQEFDDFTFEEWKEPARQRRFIIQKSLEQIRDYPDVSVEDAVSESFAMLENKLIGIDEDEEVSDSLNENIKDSCEQIISAMELDDKVRKYEQQNIVVDETDDNTSERKSVKSEGGNKDLSNYYIDDKDEMYNDETGNSYVFKDNDNNNEDYERGSERNEYDNDVDDGYENEQEDLNYIKDETEDELKKNETFDDTDYYKQMNKSDDKDTSKFLDDDLQDLDYYDDDRIVDADEDENNAQEYYADGYVQERDIEATQLNSKAGKNDMEDIVKNDDVEDYENDMENYLTSENNLSERDIALDNSQKTIMLSSSPKYLQEKNSLQHSQIDNNKQRQSELYANINSTLKDINETLDRKNNRYKSKYD